MRILRTLLTVALVVALGFGLPPTVRAICTSAWVLACVVHFVGRIVRNRNAGKGRAAGVSLFLSMLVLGPLVVTGMARGVLGYRWYELLEACSFCLASGLLISIYLVEFKDEQRKAIEQNRRDAARVVTIKEL